MSKQKLLNIRIVVFVIQQKFFKNFKVNLLGLLKSSHNYFTYEIRYCLLQVKK